GIKETNPVCSWTTCGRCPTCEEVFISSSCKGALINNVNKKLESLEDEHTSLEIIKTEGWFIVKEKTEEWNGCCTTTCEFDYLAASDILIKVNLGKKYLVKNEMKNVFLQFRVVDGNFELIKLHDDDDDARDNCLLQ
ncbi:MAG: hypothetical protein QMD14_06125, partial [Candidatus Aenigmarchaeota archaeon]|nr:hypothetical protein [Candidatus Aenigmarchaeota archaeon]